jgi:hypothetical protein
LIDYWPPQPTTSLAARPDPEQETLLADSIVLFMRSPDTSDLGDRIEFRERATGPTDEAVTSTRYPMQGADR